MTANASTKSLCKDSSNVAALLFETSSLEPGIPRRNSKILHKLQNFVQRLTPGMLLDIAADRPRVVTPLGTCLHLSVNKKGDEPDILAGMKGIEGNTQLMFRKAMGGEHFDSPNDRRKRLADPDCSSKFQIDPSLVYTLEIYDHTIHFANYQQCFGGFMKVDLTSRLNGRPLTLTFLMVPDKDEKDKVEDLYEGQEGLYDFQVWHERLVE
jgi:hypothetical protein